MAMVALSSLPLRDAWRNRPGDDRPFAAALARGTLIVAVPSRPAPTLNVGRVDHFARVLLREEVETDFRNAPL